MVWQFDWLRMGECIIRQIAPSIRTTTNRSTTPARKTQTTYTISISTSRCCYETFAKRQAHLVQLRDPTLRPTESPQLFPPALPAFDPAQPVVLDRDIFATTVRTSWKGGQGEDDTNTTNSASKMKRCATWPISLHAPNSASDYGGW